MKKGIMIISLLFLLSCNNKKIYVIFDDVETLEINSKVTCKGIEIGKINNFNLYRNKVLVELIIKDQYKITKESKFFIKQNGLLGNGIIDVVINTKNVQLVKNYDTLVGANEKNEIDRFIELLKKE